jgi:hypothetical protein
MLVFRGREGSWRVAGNGGKMAELRRKLIRAKAKGKTSSKNKGKRASRGTTACMDGAERLRQEVDRLVGLNSDALAALLTNKALRGDVVTAKALVGLAEGKKPRPEPKKKRLGPSQAEQLRMEPEWQEDREEVSAETGSGGAEGEG